MLTNLQPFDPQYAWVLVLSFLIAFLLAFSVGANDVSNSFGTSVGARVLTVTQACILATFFEVAGATLLGYTVCDTFRTSMYDVSLYQGSMHELMLGALACLIGSAAWNMIATYLKMPISGTHSIVGATIGFSIVLRGWNSIQWARTLKIAASWFASPLLSGFISSIVYLIISKTVICKIDPLKNGLKALPLFYGATIFINVASIVMDGPEIMGLNELPWYAGLFISLMAAAVTICVVAMVVVPRMRERILDEMIESSKTRGAPKPPARMLASLNQLAHPKGPISYDNTAFHHDPDTYDSKAPKKELTLDPKDLKDDSNIAKTEKPSSPRPPNLAKAYQQMAMEEIDLDPPRSVEKMKRRPSGSDVEEGHGSGRPKTIAGERLEIFRLFSSLQILTACFASFAHGTNDVSNAVAPLIPIWNIYTTGSENTNEQTQVWILLFGGIGICTGLWAWGRAVMSTMGDGLTRLTPSKGFSIELGAAISVLTATKLGLPISTTHCKVGSVVIVGLVASKFCSNDNRLVESGDEEKEKAVDWKLFGNIALTWIVTVPFAAAASAGVMLLFSWCFLPASD